MMAETTIEWTATHLPDGTALPGYTFNPWIGCQKVGPGCDHCYAEISTPVRVMRAEGQELWGPGAPRRLTSDANWRKPLAWNAQAAKSGIRRKVFCASLADVFDNAIDPAWREDLWRLIQSTPCLDWLLLTKRPGNIGGMLPTFADWGEGWPHVWLGCTVVNQAEADRDIPKLLAVPAAVRFLSVEPLLGPLDLSHWMGVHHSRDNNMADPETRDAINKMILLAREQFRAEHGNHGINWIIVGGESGPHARPMHPDWARSLRDLCAAVGVPFFFKQWGEWIPQDHLAPSHPWHTTPSGILGAKDQFHYFDRKNWSFKIGKARAGRKLDGREHNAMPGVA
jgi:protein gp37